MKAEHFQFRLSTYKHWFKFSYTRTDPDEAEAIRRNYARKIAELRTQALLLGIHLEE